MSNLPKDTPVDEANEEQVTIAQAVAQLLATLGVKHAFGLLGSGNFHVTNTLKAQGVNFYPARHENNALTMADAYARVTGEVGVCTVHQGPGLTNTLTGLAEAAKARTPLLLLAADTARAAVHSNFRINQAQLVESVGAVAERLHTPASALADALRAWRRARTQRRPVVLMMPLDVQAGEISVTALTAALAALDAGAATPDPSLAPQPAQRAVEQAADMLRQAHRPLIIAGRGAVVAGAGPVLADLAEHLGALLATSAQATGLFTGNPWSLGIMGGFSSPGAAQLIAQADVVLTFGASLNMWSTRHGRLLQPEAQVIQVDNDPQAIGARHRVDLALVGDAAAAARSLLATVQSRGWQPAAQRTPQLQAQIAQARWRHVSYEDTSGPDTIDPRTFSQAMDNLLPAQRAVAFDSGHFMGWPATYWDVPDPQGFIFPQDFQSVGLGLAAAIGAAIAQPQRLTVAALGDGGAFMAAADLETVTRLGLNLLIVVYNDAAYGAEVHHFGPHGHPLDLVQFPDFDFAALARSVGMAGVTVRQLADLRPVEEWLAAGAQDAMLVDAKITPTVVAGWLEEAFKGH